MGLCFGGGQLLLGLALLGAGMLVLSSLKWIEDRIQRDRRVTLLVATRGDGPSVERLRADLLGARFQIITLAVTCLPARGEKRIRCELLWRTRPDNSRTPEIVDRLAGTAGVARVSWNP